MPIPSLADRNHHIHKLNYNLKPGHRRIGVMLSPNYNIMELHNNVDEFKIQVLFQCKFAQQNAHNTTKTLIMLISRLKYFEKKQKTWKNKTKPILFSM